MKQPTPGDEKTVLIRPLTPLDLEALADLCAEHAAFEKAGFQREGKAAALEPWFFDTPRRAHCLVAESGDALVGFATWSLEFSTWDALQYAHLDCIYLQAPWRGRGLGKDLMGRVAAAAASAGADHVQWQTPVWNKDAIGFYKRLGATGAEKLRFRWPLPKSR